MSKFLFAAASFVSIAETIVLPLQGFEIAGNSTSIGNPSVVNGRGILQIPVSKINNTQVTKRTRKRQSLDELRNDISGYSIQIGVGTPAQLVEVQIDTGSSELWVNPDCSNAWYPYGCQQNGFYVPGSSTSKQTTTTAFSLTYGLGSVSGTYIKDNIAMGGITIVAQQFGDASTSQNMMEGVMGIGWGYGLDTTYYNVIDQLAIQGITHSRAFSLDLASIDVSEGSIIFGGIDTMKYIGALQKCPIIPRSEAPDGYARYWIYMTSLGVTTPGSSVSIPVIASRPTFSQPVFPDSGSTFCYLPQTLFNGLLALFPSATLISNNEYQVPCSLRTQAGTIDFGFGGTTIHVSYHEFFWFDGENCWLAAVPSTEFYILGDSFIRSAYIVYDQDNANVLLAQAANCGSNIIPITTGTNAVPSSTGGCRASSSTIAPTSTFTSTSKSSFKSTSSADPRSTSNLFSGYVLTSTSKISTKLSSSAGSSKASSFSSSTLTPTSKSTPTYLSRSSSSIKNSLSTLNPTPSPTLILKTGYSTSSSNIKPTTSSLISTLPHQSSTSTSASSLLTTNSEACKAPTLTVILTVTAS